MVIEFILNNETIRTDIESGLPLLDFIRERQKLSGTKIGCREGDCGACTVLEGVMKKGMIQYRTIVSCLTPMALVRGKHIVTIEGLNQEALNPVQEAIVDNNAAQCGFCTPGFVVSLSSFLINDDSDAIRSIGGNICRCTGYKSIERAAKTLAKLHDRIDADDRIDQLVQLGFLPEYFRDIPGQLSQIISVDSPDPDGITVGGGTDLMVQRAGEMMEEKVIPAESLLSDEIECTDGHIKIGGAVKIHDFLHHELIQKVFPQVKKVLPWFASDPIRHMGTLSGNIVNASPIGDLTITLLAMDASLVLKSGNGSSRKLKLREFYLGYKKTMLEVGELIEHILLEIPEKPIHFHFSKVSKRNYLDIASVNSAICILLQEKIIDNIHLSIGGIAAIPFYAEKTTDFLKGKKLEIDLLKDALKILQEEIAPISDIRGSGFYKRLLVRQQFFGHFLYLFPAQFHEKEVYDLLLTNPLTHEEY